MKTLLLKFTFLALLFFATKVMGQAFNATYTFTSAGTATGRTDPTPVPTATGITFGSFTAETSDTSLHLGTNPNASGRFSFVGWPLGATNGSNTFTGAINTGQYYQVKLAVQQNYIVKIDSITFTQQRSGTGIRRYAVRSSRYGFASNLPSIVEPANANIVVVGADTFQVATDLASPAAENGSKTVLYNVSSFQNITDSITFRFYGWDAEGSGGTFSIDNVKFSGSATILANAPNIIPSTTSLNFPSTPVGSSSIKTYSLTAANLSGPVTITTTTPYTLSDALNGTYTSSLTVPAADLASSKTIYVKFTPPSLGTFSANITHTSSGAADQNVAVVGDGIDPNNLTFNFDNCTSAGTPGGGFLSYSVTGPQKWACSNFGRNSTKGVDVNGYSGGAQENEDWLISPPLSISSLSLPILRFWSRGEFSGPSLQLLVSTNYDGSSNPNTASWTNLDGNFPPLTNTWTLSDGIDLSAYKGSSKVYVAFKYTSSAELGAARWTLDDVDVTDRSTLITASPTSLNYGEASVGTNSAGLPFVVKAIGYGNITIKAPAGYQVSTDSTSYADSIVVSQAAAQAGVKLFARFSPKSKALKVVGQLRFTGTGLDSMNVALSGTSYPKSETFDVGCYNLSFFGSNSTNNPTPEKISTQITNIATVLQRINLDVVGIEEVSNDSALTELLKRLPNRKSVISNRWSYSFNPPDPNFPPQKTGFIYDTTTTKLVEARDLFVSLYDSVLNGHPEKLPNYPGGTPSSFWASGRLPFMATFDETSGGITKRIRVVDIHAKSASDASSYNRRVYDVKVLKDTLDAYYPTDNIIIVGDYNDRLAGSINTGATSPYKPYVDDSANYVSLTYPLDVAGRVSFVSGTGMIDQLITSNELKSFNIPNSTDIEDPRSYISNYGANTASDHLPVYSRFTFSGVTLPVTLASFNAAASGSNVLVTWSTATELNNSYFIVERSADGRTFETIGTQKALNSNVESKYQLVDYRPLQGVNYYRLKQVDVDGRSTLSNTVSVNFSGSDNSLLSIYPNPVVNSIKITMNSTAKDFTAQIIGADGSLRVEAKGDVNQVNQQINQRLNSLSKGVYILNIGNASEKHVLKFIKQ